MRRLICIILATSAACGDVESSQQKVAPTTTAEHFSELRVYAYEVFGARQACTDYNEQHPGLWINCQRIAEFATDGRMGVMFTDIPSRGTYAIADSAIECLMESFSDAPETFTFQMQADGREIVLNDEVWLLDESATPFLVVP